MKTTALFILLMIISISLYSQKFELEKIRINGSWIEKENGIDTITFLPKYDGLNPIFDLKRGYRITEGNKLPDYFSGSYYYNIGENCISIYYWFSSNGSYKSYYFKMSPDSSVFFIGNFFKEPEKKKIERDTLIFIKLK